MSEENAHVYMLDSLVGVYVPGKDAPRVFFNEAAARRLLLHDELLACLEELVEAFWGDHPESFRATFRHDYPDHFIVLAEAVIQKAKGRGKS